MKKIILAIIIISFNSSSIAQDITYYTAVKNFVLGYSNKAKTLGYKNISEYPKASVGYYLLGKIYWQENNNDSAIYFFKRAYKISPENKWYEYYYSLSLIKANKLKKGFEIGTEFLSKTQDQNIFYNYLKLTQQYKQDDYFIKISDLYTKKFGLDKNIANYLIKFYTEKNNYDKIISILRKLLANYPYDQSLIDYYTYILLKTNRLGELQALAKNYTITSPKANEFLFFKYLENKQIDSAKQIMHNIIKSNLFTETQKIRLVDTLDNYMQPDERMQLIKELYRYNKSSAEISKLYLTELINTGQLNSAKNVLLKTLKFNPNYRDLYVLAPIILFPLKDYELLDSILSIGLEKYPANIFLLDSKLIVLYIRFNKLDTKILNTLKLFDYGNYEEVMNVINSLKTGKDRCNLTTCSGSKLCLLFLMNSNITLNNFTNNCSDFYFKLIKKLYEHKNED